MKRVLPFLLTLVLFVAPAAAEKLVVGLPEPGRLPFFRQDSPQRYSGTYVTLLEKIGALAGVEIEFRMVPQARLILEFAQGMIDIEPGIAPAWRPSEGEAAISRYTQPFMKMDDVLIFPAVKPLPAIRSMDELSKLKGLKVGQVRGFFVPPGLDLSLMANERDIARLVDAGVLDGGFMNASVAAYFKSEYGYGYQASPPFASTPVCLRLHVRHAAWLAPFNDAIEELRRTGELQHILEISR